MGLKSKRAGKIGKVTQGDLAERCQLDQGTVSRILNADSRGQYPPETVNRVLKAAREMGYLHPRLLKEERRRSPRKDSRISARVQINLADGSLYDQGECTIANISVTGMHLNGFRTSKMAMPLQSFRLWLTFDVGSLKAVNIRSATTWVQAHGPAAFGVGVRYEYFSHDPGDIFEAVSEEAVATPV